MKKYICITALTLLTGCAGTIPPWLQDAETRAAAIVTKIKTAVPLIEGEIDSGIAAVCSKIPDINNTVATLINELPNPGPKTKMYIQLADTSLETALAACTAWAAAPSTSGSVSFFLRLYNAYASGKSAMLKAQAAGGM